MSRKIYDLAVAVESYEKDGQKKNKYQNIGAIIEKDDGGRFMLLDRYFNAAGVPNPNDRSNVMVSLFEPKDRAQNAGSYRQNTTQNASFGQQSGDVVRPPEQGPEDFQDDIPF